MLWCTLAAIERFLLKRQRGNKQLATGLPAENMGKRASLPTPAVRLASQLEQQPPVDTDPDTWLEWRRFKTELAIQA